jgi:K+-transporting ATPase KdpF subunit
LPHARRSHAFLYRRVFRRGLSVCEGVPEVEVAMDLITAIALFLSVLLLIYLTASLLFPEKF